MLSEWVRIQQNSAGSFPVTPPQGLRSPSVTDVLLLDAAVVSPTERELGPPGRLHFNKSGHNSFHTCGVKQGEVCVGGGGCSADRNQVLTSFVRVLENVNRQLNAQ